MSSYIHILDRESLLLMYLADELSAEDRAEIEEMLKSDAKLRAEFERLADAQQLFSTVLAGADEHQPLPAPVQSSLRRISGAIGQWQVDRLSLQARPRNSIRRTGLLYATATIAAAVIVLIVFVWNGAGDIGGPLPSSGNGQTASTTDSKNSSETEVAINNDASNGEEYFPADSGAVEQNVSNTDQDLYALSSLTDAIRTTEDTSTP